jgi:hypothetical protein
MATKQQKPREAYVECEVLPGMFPGEYLAIFEALDPNDPNRQIKVRVLVDKENIEVGGVPEKGKPARGQLRVYVAEKKKGYVLVILPQPGQPVGESAVVHEDDLAMAT